MNDEYLDVLKNRQRFCHNTKNRQCNNRSKIYYSIKYIGRQSVVSSKDVYYNTNSKNGDQDFKGIFILPCINYRHMACL